MNDDSLNPIREVYKRFSHLDEVWNTVAGCSHAHSGCDYCYAEQWSWRLGQMGKKDYQELHNVLPPDFSKVWNGQVRCLPHKLDQPRHWKRPRVIGGCFMADWMHPLVPDEFIADIITTVCACWQHRFLFLTKRAARLRDCAENVFKAVPKNLALGVSCSTQDDVGHMVPDMLATPAACRMLSLEPLLGPVDLLAIPAGSIPGYAGLRLSDFLHGVIVGGESGPKARPMHPDWVRSIRDQCAGARVPFYFKQWGGWIPSYNAGGRSEEDAGFRRTFGDAWVLKYYRFADGQGMVRASKVTAGYLLDGREHRELPAFFDLGKVA